MIGGESSGALGNEIAAPVSRMMHRILAMFALDCRLCGHLISRFIVVAIYLQRTNSRSIKDGQDVIDKIIYTQVLTCDLVSLMLWDLWFETERNTLD
jgi:hypothetical protein